MKRIISFIFEPFKSIGSRGVAQFISRFLNKNGYILYILSFVTTLIIILLTYIV